MVNIPGIKHCAPVFLIFTFATHSFGQVDQARLDSLKSRYPWGSVYLTHTSLLNLESILKDDSKRRIIAREYGDDLVSRLQAWIQSEKTTKISESVAFVEIDLNRIEAGYKKIPDSGGEIKTIPWTKPEVVNIAHLYDRQLIAVNTFNKVKQQIHDKETIQTIWDGLTSIQGDPYASSEMVYVLARNFREQLNNQEVQLNELKTQNPALYESLIEFKQALNDSLASYQKYFSSKAIALQVNNAEFKELVALFETSIKEPGSPSNRELASVQTDLSGTYTGTFNCEALGLTGDTSLTIIGNDFATADGKTGRIVASTTRGYTAVTLQMGGTETATPTIVSLRAKKSGGKLTLTPSLGASMKCSFTPARNVAGRKRTRTPKFPPATGTEVANPGVPTPTPAETPMPAQTPSPSPSPSPTPVPSPTPPNRGPC